jgi:hypothetical protein
MRWERNRNSLPLCLHNPRMGRLPGIRFIRAINFLNLRNAVGVTSLDPVLEIMLNPDSVAAVYVKALSETEFEYGRFSSCDVATVAGAIC